MTGMSDAEVALAERLFGRKLTLRERLEANVTRDDDRDFETKFRQDTFQPVMADDGKTEIQRELDVAIREAEEAKFHAAYKTATPEERRVMDLKKLAHEEAQKIEHAEKYAAQMKERQPMIKHLDELEKRAAMDPAIFGCGPHGDSATPVAQFEATDFKPTLLKALCRIGAGH